MKKRKSQLQTQVTFRIPDDLRKFYEKAAEREQRRLSDMLRIVLQDHRPIIEERQQAA